MKKRVVITGIGAVTPVGNTVDKLWDSVREGINGINNIESFETEGMKVKLAAEVKDFKPEDVIDKLDLKRMDRFSHFAMVASHEAVMQSRINFENVNRERVGVIIGSGIAGINTLENEHKKLINRGANRVSPYFYPMVLNNMVSGNIAIKYGAKGICYSIVTACATGSNAIGEAFKMIQADRADIILAGGTESAITPLAISGFSAMRALSFSNEPNRASIPFDKERNGFVMGEGAGIIVLESLESAQKRNANILAEVVGYGVTCDGYHMTTPDLDGDGAARAMKMAMKEAGVEPENISYINAHGTSTQYNDKIETKAIKTALGKIAYEVPISSTKSMTGHMLGAAGAVEAIICVKSIEEKFLPPTIGLKEADPECDLDYIPNVGREAEVIYTMSNSLGFGGHNASIILKKWNR